jgi:hypothetical protein
LHASFIGFLLISLKGGQKVFGTAFLISFRRKLAHRVTTHCALSDVAVVGEQTCMSFSYILRLYLIVGSSITCRCLEQLLQEWSVADELAVLDASKWTGRAANIVSI